MSKLLGKKENQMTEEEIHRIRTTINYLKYEHHAVRVKIVEYLDRWLPRKSPEGQHLSYTNFDNNYVTIELMEQHHDK